MLSRVYFSGYLIRALSVTMNSWAQIPLPGRQVSSDRDYVLQALHVLDTMGNDIAIHRVANLMRELFTLLSGPLEITALPRARMNNGTQPRLHATFSNFTGLSSSRGQSYESSGSDFSAFNLNDPSGIDTSFPGIEALNFNAMGP